MTTRGTQYWNGGAIPLIAPEILGDIIAEVSDLGIVISDAGTVLSVLANPSQDFFRRLDHWDGKDLRDVLAVESVSKFNARLEVFLTGGRTMRAVELNHSDDAGLWEFPIRYSFHRIGPDGAILLLGRDLRPVAEIQQQLIKAQMALERDYEAQREFDTRFRVLMESTREALIFVAVKTGKITEANSIAAACLDRPRDELVGVLLAGEFELRKRGDLIEALTAQATAVGGIAVQGLMRKSGALVAISPTLFRAAGEPLLLCRIAVEAQDTAQADRLTLHLNALYLHSPDAIVFVDEAGLILSANEGFLDLIDVAHDLNVKGRSMADYLQRGSVDLKVLTENAARNGRLRLYPTKIAGEFSSARSVEIAVTCMAAGPNRLFAFVIRDSRPAETARPVGMATPNTSMTADQGRSIMDLVGSATLRDIVAQTTDVVEKMCIETAVHLTMNNRVAAAEMLGLSRQSLYVKLRKYDLLVRGD